MPSWTVTQPEFSKQPHTGNGLSGSMTVAIMHIYIPSTYVSDWLFKTAQSGFPGGAVVENLPANAGDTGSSPGLGRSHMPQSN